MVVSIMATVTIKTGINSFVFYKKPRITGVFILLLIKPIKMNDFKKTIEGMDFTFHGVMEGPDQVFRVQTDTHNFKMTTDEDGNWGIWQQVPRWIKDVEEELEKAIEEQIK